MLSGKKLTFEAKTIVDDVAIARFFAVLRLDDNKLDLNTNYLDGAACQEHRDVVRADQEEFENFVYQVQDSLNQ